MVDSHAIGILAALGSAASWSIGAVLFKQLGDTLSSFAMTLMKGAVSVVLLGLATLLVGGFSHIPREAYYYLALSGLVGIALSDTFFFSALKEVSPQSLTLLLTFGQVLTALLAVILLGEALPLQGWAGIAVIVTGITIGMFHRSADKGRSSVRGIIFGLISVISMAVAVILTKKGLTSTSTLYATFIRMLAGTVGMLLLGIATKRLGGWVSPFSDMRLAWKFALPVFVITFGGFWLAIVAFKYTSVAVANSLIATEPIFVLPMAAIFLKEKVTLHAAAGAGIATVGVIVLCTSGIVM